MRHPVPCLTVHVVAACNKQRKVQHRERDFAASSEIAACIKQRSMQQAACSNQRKVQHAASAQSTCSEASTPLERFINRSNINGGNHTNYTDQSEASTPLERFINRSNTNGGNHINYTGPFVPGARALHFLYIRLYRLVWPRFGQCALLSQ